MALISRSEPGRFVVIEGLHLDRSVFETLLTWAEPRGLTVQDAIQVALWFFNDRRDHLLDRMEAVRSDGDPHLLR